MTKDLFFKIVANKVRKECTNLGYRCLSDREKSSIKVLGSLNYDGRQVLTDSLITSVSSIPNVVFNNVSIDSNGRLFALFFINDSDGNSVESD